MNKITKILITITILFVVVVANAYTAMPQSGTNAPIKIGSQAETSVVLSMNVATDTRAKALQIFLEKRNSPLAAHASAYVEIADKYNIDWKLLPAIAGLESSFGLRQMPGSHNSYGWGGGHIYFTSYEDGIEKILSSLRKRYYDRGADTVYKIAPIYAESPTWAPRVTKFMNQIEAEYNLLKTTTLTLTI